jgi:hypothetical protein
MGVARGISDRKALATTGHGEDLRKDPVREPQFPTGSTPESKTDSDLASVTGFVETSERG